VIDAARVVARRAYTYLCQAGETGDWALLLDMLTDDFEFLFPAGQYQGQHRGSQGHALFRSWAAHRQTSRSTKTLELELDAGEWMVFCVNSAGKDAQGPFQTHVALFFRVRDQQISAYREYIGDITAWI
jgi:ketosteroid isomerase-like protein